MAQKENRGANANRSRAGSDSAPQSGFLGSPARRLLFAITGIVVLLGAGAAGYILIEEMTFLDALYMSVITISTVGYREVKPLSAEGQIFTMVLIVTGVGTGLYLLAVAAEVVIEGQLRDFLGISAMQRKIHQLEKHVIVCGFGRFGRVVTEELKRHDVPVVVIESNPALEKELSRLEVLHVNGSALEDEILEEAGIQSARAIVVATDSDADNVYITLSAREKNPGIAIHARGESETGLRRLKSAGANQVISAYQRGGMRIASMILRPAVVDFLELATPGHGDEIDLEEIEIEPGSHAVGKTIEAVERGTAKLRVVALKRGDDPISIIPDPGTIVKEGDHLVAIGDAESLKHLADILEE
ncbi:MAG: potassium channel protein [Candidatus Binatus sp.]|uniref:potassium channel family protein n=1 Tax=Candidatus Binatus sp. TaxID=2811406 RepID=UPI002723CCD9|nr:potassium channel protein [Candidatus Binatus sp.]MDO8433500.1 potassium channel protein [Candidatus Binatus sp.]